MTTREVVKIKNGWTVVSDDIYEASYRHPTKRSAEAQLAQWARCEADKIANDRVVFAARLEGVNAYLAVRAARKVEDAKQFAFNF